jgi:CDP-diacylglycerol--serine O-phosphatidyltransferase
MGNLLCGFLSIMAAHNGNLARAAWLIILAAFMDALDGRVARLARSTSKFGQELDSLADIVSFGVAPAFLTLIAVLNDFDAYIGWVVAVFFIMTGAFRLARYNVISDPHRKTRYLGLPIPTAAVTIASYIILCMKYFQEVQYPEFFVTMVIALSGLMVSTVAYDTLPEKFDTTENRLKALGVFVFLVAVVVKPRMMIFPGVALYILLGVVKEGWRIMVGSSSRIRKDRSHVSEE